MARAPPGRGRGRGRGRAGRAARPARRRVRRVRGRRSTPERARRALPRLADARALQAAARLPFRRRAAQERVGQAPAPPAAHDGRRPHDGVRRLPGRARDRAWRGDDHARRARQDQSRHAWRARDELAQVFAELGGDAGVRASCCRGAGEQAFTRGRRHRHASCRATPRRSRTCTSNVAAPERCPKPVVAQLHGYCFGVGLELALACDFRVASDDAQLALPELTLGMIPGSGGASRLVKMVGVGARQGHRDARAARLGAPRRWPGGCVCEVVPRGRAGAAVASLADELAAPPGARAARPPSA